MGESLARPYSGGMTERPAERRFVAIVFAEFAGLSGALEGRGVEAGAELADALFRRVRAAVESRGGSVDKFAGETVMAVFGAPVAHGDDAARAVLAATDLRRETESESRARGVQLGFRAGVNAGEVLWAGVAGERATAMGDAVNVAQRLQSVAAPGQILVSAAVEPFARRRARFTTAGLIAVRGRVEPVAAFECEGPRESGTGAFAGVETPLCGRDRELAAVAAAREAGRGGFFWIEGEAGIGKSRLLLAILERAGEKGLSAWGRAAEGGGEPFAAPAMALRHAARRGGARGLAPWLEATFAAGGHAAVERENLAHLVALSAGEDLPGARVLALPAEVRREETLFAWERWLRLRAASAPVTLVLDDLQSADPATLALLGRLAARLRGCPVTIAAAARPGAARPDGFEALPLLPLAPGASTALAAAAFRRAASLELLRFVAERAAGSPFAVLELARHLEDANLVEGEPLRLSGPAAGIPRGLQPLLQARLDALGTQVKESLKSASVIGRTFWTGILRGVAGDAAADALPAAERLGLVARAEDSTLAGNEEYAFTDGLLQEAARALVPRRDRARLHRATAQALESLPGRPRRAVALAAAHREEAGEPSLASALWSEAAENALDAASVEEAGIWAVKARAAEDNPRARLAAARAAANALRSAEAVEITESVLRDPAITPLQSQQARIVQANAEAARGRMDSALRIIESVFATKPDDRILLSALHSSSYVKFHLGRLDEALAEVRQTLEVLGRAPLAGHRPSPSAREEARVLLAQVHLRSGRVDEALAELQSLAAASPGTGEPAMRAMILINLGNVRFLRAEVGEARAAYEEALSVARSIGDRTKITAALQNLSNVLCARGDFGAALAADLEVLRMRDEIGDRRMRGSTLINVASSRMLTGDEEGAARDFGEALAGCRESGNNYDEAMTLIYMADLALKKGDRAAAGAALGEAAAIVESQRFESLRSSVNRLRGLLAADADPEGAARELEAAVELARSNRDPRGEAVAVSALARVRAQAGRASEALGLLQRALELAPVETAAAERLQVLEDAAASHLALGRASAARESVASGLGIARRSGAGAALRRLEALARLAGA